MQSGEICGSNAFFNAHDDRSVPRSFDFERTIDMLERRQEAAVLRQLRKINTTDSIWALDSTRVIAETMRPFEQLRSDQFRNLSKAQIAEVMAGEQKLLESRLQRRIFMKQIKSLKREFIKSRQASEGV